MFIDRESGKSSNKIVAAELALARLKDELQIAWSKVIPIELDIEQENTTLAELSNFFTQASNFNEQDIMSEKEVESAHNLVRMLKAKAETLKDEKENYQEKETGPIYCLTLFLCPIIAFILAIGVAQYSVIMAVVLFIPFGIVAYLLLTIIFFIWTGIRGSRRGQMEENLKDVKQRISQCEQQIQRHQIAVESREAYQEAYREAELKKQNAISNISRNQELLPKAQAEIKRIEAEIAHYQKIVSLKH